MKPTRTSTVARSYDANSRLLQVNDSASGLFDFTYDSVGRLTSSTAPAGGLQYIHDAASRPITRQVIGQAPVNYTYDRNGNLLTASITGASIGRAYDARNLPLTTSRANGVTSQNAYDALGRVLSMTHAGPGGVLDNETYSYDAVGNRLNSTIGIAQPIITPPMASAAYDVNNEQNRFGSATNTFDANGNLTSSSSSGGSSTYTWDSRNRLSSVIASGGQTTHFTYDFAGKLIQQVDTGSSLNLTQTFVLDDFTNVTYVGRSDGDQYSVLSGPSIDDHIAATHASGQIEYGAWKTLSTALLPLLTKQARSRAVFYMNHLVKRRQQAVRTPFSTLAGCQQALASIIIEPGITAPPLPGSSQRIRRNHHSATRICIDMCSIGRHSWQTLAARIPSLSR